MSNFPSRVFFICDRVESVFLYRIDLIRSFESLSCNVSVVSIFSPFSLIKSWVYSVFNDDSFFVSSNLRSNIIFLLLLNLRGVLILNGLGRYRSVFAFRYFLGFLFSINRRKSFLIQNYADFRYFRRFYKGSFYWIPGSGGRRRTIGDSQDFVLVTRAAKVHLIWDSVFDFFFKNNFLR